MAVSQVRSTLMLSDYLGRNSGYRLSQEALVVIMGQLRFLKRPDPDHLSSPDRKLIANHPFHEVCWNLF